LAIRRLSAAGLTFGEILNQLRSDLAMLYLSERNLSISQIAWLLAIEELVHSLTNASDGPE